MSNIRLACVILCLLLIPNVALAEPIEPVVDAGVTFWVMRGAGYVLAAAALLSRVAPVIRPWVLSLPATRRWVPLAVGATAAVLLTSLPMATTVDDVVLSLVSGAVTFWASSQPGSQTPDHDTPVAPTTPTIVAMLCLGLLALGLTSCAPALSRTVSSRTPATKACKTLSSAEHTLRYVAVGSAALAGGSGLATIPADTSEADRGLAITAATAGVVAVTAEAVRAELGRDYLESCQ